MASYDNEVITEGETEMHDIDNSRFPPPTPLPPSHHHHGNMHSQAEGNRRRGTGITDRIVMGYARLLVALPSLVVIIVLICVITMSLVGFLLADLPSFDDPSEGFGARGTDISGRLMAYSRLVTETERFFPYPTGMSGGVLPGPANTSTNTNTNTNTNDSTSTSTNSSASSVRVERQAGSRASQCGNLLRFPDRIRMVYRSESPISMFSAMAMKAVCTFDQEALRASQTFYDICENSTWYDDDIGCCPSWSLGHVTALLVGKDTCDAITETDVDSVKDLLRECVRFYQRGCLNSDAAACSDDVPDNCTLHEGVDTILSYLTPEDFVTRVVDGSFDLSISMVFPPLADSGKDVINFYRKHIDSLANEDRAVELIAVGLGSKRELFSTYLLADTVYVLLGCACILIIAWIYMGSLFITLMTIVSIVISMLVAYFIYHIVFRLDFFPFINIITIVLLIGVGADDSFVFVDIWKQTKEEHVSDSDDMPLLLAKTLRHAAITMFVTSLTTSSALFAGVVSSTTAIRCFSVFAGSAILVNFILTITWIPAAVIIHEKYFLCRTENGCCGLFTRVYDKVATSGRVFFQVTLPMAIKKLRILWIISLTGFAVAALYSVFISPRLQLPSSSFQIFRPTHLTEQYDQVYIDMFNFEEDVAARMPAIFLWGVKPVDNGNHWNPDSNGTTVMDESFDISSPESQEWVYNFCSAFRRSSFRTDLVLSSTNDEDCFIETFREFMEQPCSSSAIGGSFSPCCDQQNFPYSADLFNECIIIFYTLRCQTYPCDPSSPGLRFTSNDTIVVLGIYLQTNVAASVSYETTGQFWSDFKDWTDAQLATAPVGLQNGWCVSVYRRQIGFYDLQRALAIGTPIAVGVSLAVAAVVLLCTMRNVILTIFAMYTIACAVFVIVACLVHLGWELNIFESTILSLAVGLSVDFTIHLGVAYRQTEAPERTARSFHALRALSSAVTVAALTTLTAGACMLPATVISYVQLGSFLILGMATSWIYGVFLFMSLCWTLGPEARCGNLSLPCCSRCLQADNAASMELTGTNGHAYDNHGSTHDDPKH